MRNVAVATLLVLCIFTSGQEKTVLSHLDYDKWNDLEEVNISGDGNWISYEINPQKGDGDLYLINTNSRKSLRFPRSGQASFHKGNGYFIFITVPGHEKVRMAKSNNGGKLPPDTLRIWSPEDGVLKTYAEVISYKVSREPADWLPLLCEHTDTAGKKRKVLKVFNLNSRLEQTFSGIIDYGISESGRIIYFSMECENGEMGQKVMVFDTRKGSANPVFEGDGEVARLISDKEGNQVAFLHTEDTTEVKEFSLMYWRSGHVNAGLLFENGDIDTQPGWMPSINGEMSFSGSGKRLFLGMAPNHEKSMPDTLPDDEKIVLDIWSWNDPLLQPQQKVELEREKKRTFLAMYEFGPGQFFQLADRNIPRIMTSNEGDGRFFLGISPGPWEKLVSWESPQYHNFYSIDTKSEEKRMILEKEQGPAELSSLGKFFIWYDRQALLWKTMDLAENKVSTLHAKGMDFHDNTFDLPGEPGPYGIAGWTENDKEVLIYDRYDIWKFNPGKGSSPVNITKGYGRENHLVLRYQPWEGEDFIPVGKDNYLTAYHTLTRQSGFFLSDLLGEEPPKELILKDYHFEYMDRSDDGNRILYTRETYREYPDVWLSDRRMEEVWKVSEANPQQDEYSWGRSSLVSWTDMNGKPIDGLLMVPDDFDPAKKYPLLVYFYDRHSEDLHQHYGHEAHRSVITPTLYTSDGYVVFMPDIVYEIGYPGQSAFDAVVSGTHYLINQGFIDVNRIGVQGQSWGGYQVAYLVTQTDMFTAAMSGAPVSNMVSAYGGIRWSSGRSRMMQYEEGQSRIGATLWERPFLYIDNSPIFFADRVNTPLLMRHDDADGAVPWYQGIEYFVALRRLGKPVWMLNYNDEPHVLQKRANKIDFAIRMKQFFDHYLKGMDAPAWMLEGVPALKKGRTYGYETINNKK